MTTAYFVDLDGTLIYHGDARRIVPESKAHLDELGADPNNQIWFFSCWAFTPDDQAFLRANFPYARGFLRKPLADRYAFIDDKHDDSLSKALNDEFMGPSRQPHTV